MANLIDVKVPDIGEFSDVPIIEVLVKPGDPIKAEQSLITLESDKASMEVPSPVDGVVKEIKVKVGDKVSEGTLILTAEAEAAPAGVVTQGEGDGRRHGDRRRRAGCRLRRGIRRLRGGRGAGARHRRLQRRADHRDRGEGRRQGQARRPADHPRVRQGVDGSAVAQRRHREGPQSQRRGQGQCRKPDPDIGDRSRRRSSGRALGSTRVGDRAGRAGPAGGQTFGRRRRRMRHAGPRRRTGRLFGGVPLRRPRHDDGAGGALSDARRRLPQCRLHPLEGAAAHRRRHGRSQGNGRARHRLFGAADRPCQAARSQGEGGRQIDRRPGRHGEGAQGLRAAGRRTVSRPLPPRSRCKRRRRAQGRQVRQGDHRGRLAGHQAAVHSGRPPRGGFDRRIWSCDRFPNRCW